MNYGSVCSGIEAATAAWHPLGWSPQWFAEIEPFPSAVLAHHYPDVPNHGDFTRIDASNATPIDLLVGGTPCQAFSVAGLRGGLADARGNLSLEFLRLADRMRPKWLVWENVPGVFSSTSHDAPDPCPPTDDLDGADGPRDGQEVMVEDEYDTDESHAFSCFLAGLSELGYGFAYRVLDAQFTGVPQRRRRVFVVGHLGDWRRAAAVLFERHCLQGHPAPSRETREVLAGSLAARTRGGGGLGTDFDLAGGLQVAGGGSAEMLSTAPALTHHGGRFDFDTEAFVTGALCSNKKAAGSATNQDAESGLLVAHALRADGFDASEDGTGRGTPLIPCSVSLRTRDGSVSAEMGSPGIANALRGSSGGRAGEGAGAVLAPVSIAFAPTTADPLRSASDSPAAHGKQNGRDRETIVAFDWQSGGDARGLDPKDTAQLQRSQIPAVHSRMSVRRLMPVECERLMGFPDNFTRIPWRKRAAKQCPDGPRYRALGNSMVVPVMRWIGERIQLVDGEM